jgi:hypothetical protein
MHLGLHKWPSLFNIIAGLTLLTSPLLQHEQFVIGVVADIEHCSSKGNMWLGLYCLQICLWLSLCSPHQQGATEPGGASTAMCASIILRTAMLHRFRNWIGAQYGYQTNKHQTWQENTQTYTQLYPHHNTTTGTTPTKQMHTATTHPHSNPQQPITRPTPRPHTNTTTPSHCHQANTQASHHHNNTQSLHQHQNTQPLRQHQDPDTPTNTHPTFGSGDKRSQSRELWPFITQNVWQPSSTSQRASLTLHSPNTSGNIAQVVGGTKSKLNVPCIVVGQVARYSSNIYATWNFWFWFWRIILFCFA